MHVYVNHNTKFGGSRTVIGFGGTFSTVFKAMHCLNVLIQVKTTTTITGSIVFIFITVETLISLLDISCHGSYTRAVQI